MREGLIRQYIQQGSIFYTNLLNQDANSHEPHNFIVLNSAPVSQDVVILVTCTTQHNRVKKRVISGGFSLDTMVFIPAKDTRTLKRDTSINCNEFQDPSFDEFMNTIISGKLGYRGTIETFVLNRLIESIQLSTKLPKKYEGIF